MRRIALAAMLAGFMLLGSTTAANDGPNTFGYGCFGWGIRLAPRIHQHGPLYNYGPYYGYPPFEPYGYWNSYLQYTGPVPLPSGANNPNAYGWIHGPNPSTFGNGFPHPLAGISGGGGVGLLRGSHGRTSTGGCTTCGAAAQQVVNSGNALDRYTGIGNPSDSQAFYVESPSIITVGFPGR